MRRGLLLVLVLLLGLPAAALAQTRERVKITNVRLGLPVGPFNTDSSRRGMFKAGQWAPVYVDLECVRDTEEPLQIVVETTDADEAITEGTIEIAAMAKGDRLQRQRTRPARLPETGASYASVTSARQGAENGRTFGESGERTFVERRGPGLCRWRGRIQPERVPATVTGRPRRRWRRPGDGAR